MATVNPYHTQILKLLEDVPGKFTTAREVAEILGIDARKASGALVSLKNKGKIAAKPVHAGMSQVNCYYLIN